MPLTAIFVRHGESQANIDGIFANRPGIPGDLTPAGIAQAEELARALVPYGVTHIYTSPIDRARQTAEILATLLGTHLEIADALREYDVGDFEGLPYAGDHAWRWERYMQVERDWLEGHHDACHPGGESRTDAVNRFLPFMERLVDRHSDGDVVLAVGHGGFYRLVLPALFTAITPQFARDHTMHHGDIVIGVHERGSWHCRWWIDADTAPDGTS